MNLTREQIDALAELAGECRHDWEPKTESVCMDGREGRRFIGFYCRKCDTQQDTTAVLTLPAVGDGTWEPTLEELIGIIDEQDWLLTIERDDGTYFVEVSMWRDNHRACFCANGNIDEALAKAILKAAGRWEE